MSKMRGTARPTAARVGSDIRQSAAATTVAGVIAGALVACGPAGDTSSSLFTGEPHGSGDVTYDYEDGGPVVGKLRVTAPETEHLIVRGTLPVPPGMVVDGQDRASLAVINGPGPTAAVTQVEMVSRYPDAADGADVVELLAHVHRPLDVEPGTILDYEVVLSPTHAVEFEASPAVEALMDAPGALKLVAHDPLGLRYEADVLDKARRLDEGVEMTRQGPVVNEVRVPGVLLPVEPAGGATGALPRLMGVTTFIRTFRLQDYFAVDLHVHNAFDGTDDSVDWDVNIDELYFRDFSVRLPQGWKVLHAYDTPYSGPARDVGNMQEAPIVDSLPGGKMHLMPRQSQFVRRMVITRERAEELARVELEHGNLGFCISGQSDEGDELWSWWNGRTSRFLPQNHVLPDLSEMTTREAIDAQAASELQQRIGQVAAGATGPYPVEDGALGWCHPWGIAYGGMTGGEGIQQSPGIATAWSASPSAYRLTELRSKMTTERQPFALLAANGKPTRLADHVNPTGSHGSWVPWDMLMTFVGNDSYFFGSSVDHQADYVRANGLEPRYEERLNQFRPIDLQHLTRYTSDLIVLSWLGNDSVAKEQLRQTGELYRMTHHEHFVNNFGYVSGGSLKKRQLYVEEHPGIGLAYGRGQGWGLFAAAAAYALGDEDLRERYYPWFEEISRVVREGQSTCTGNITAIRMNRHLDGIYFTRQSFEHSFVINALESIRTTAFAGVDSSVDERLRETIMDAAYSTVRLPFWDPSFGGHMKLVGVGRSDHSIPDFCEDLPPDANYGSTNLDHETPMPTWAFAYRLSGDGIFLQRASSSIGVTGDLESELNLLGPGKLPHSAHLLGLMQGMGSNY